MADVIDLTGDEPPEVIDLTGEDDDDGLAARRRCRAPAWRRTCLVAVGCALLLLLLLLGAAVSAARAPSNTPAPAAKLADFVSRGTKLSGPYTLRFSTGEVFNGGSKYELGVLGVPLLDAALASVPALAGNTAAEKARTTRRYAYVLEPSGKATNCGCPAGTGPRGDGCRGGKLVVTCGARKAAFVAKEPQSCL